MIIILLCKLTMSVDKRPQSDCLVARLLSVIVDDCEGDDCEEQTSCRNKKMCISSWAYSSSIDAEISGVGPLRLNSLLVAIWISCVSHLCLHWCFAHLCAVPEPRHMCWGSGAHQSRRLNHQIQQWLMIWYEQHIHHQLMMFSDHIVSITTICSKCHYTKHPDMLALVLCTSERCAGIGHIRCCSSSAHQPQGLYHQIQQWLMIWDAQQMTFYEPCCSAATTSSKCRHIKHTVVLLALMFCTSERCTWTGRMCCSLWTAVIRFFCTCLHEAATDELGSAANLLQRTQIFFPKCDTCVWSSTR